MRLLKINIIITAMLAMLFTVSCSKNNKSKSSNGLGLSNNEAKSAAVDTSNNSDNKNNLFNSWDTNSDGIITQAEFTNQLDDSIFFDRWDANGDGALSKPEWNDGVANFFRPYGPNDYRDFKFWDKNGDGVVKENEFNDGIFDFVDHNSNDKISDNEFVNWFGWWPGNNGGNNS